MELSLLVALVILGLVAGASATSGEKTQAIRLYVDILTLGPLLIYIGYERSDALGYALILFGASTISYNYVNYRREEQKNREIQPSYKLIMQT